MEIYCCKLAKYPKRNFIEFQSGYTLGRCDTEDIGRPELKEALENQDWSMQTGYFDSETMMYYHTNMDIILAFMNGWTTADTWYRNYRFQMERFYALN